MTGEAAGGGDGRLAAVRDWLHGHADRPLARLALLWLRRYLEASRNSGAAASIYFTLSALPTALVVIAFFNLAAKNENAFSNRLIAHMKLDGATASLVRELFGSTSNNVLAATLTIVFGFLLWGLGIGQVYRDLYARAWRIQVGSVTDQVRFAIWFFAASGLVALMTVSAANLRSDGWLVLIPAWIAASIIFWLWTPRFLLHRKVTLRALLPGALLASLVLGAHGRHRAALDRAHREPECACVRLLRRRHRSPRLHLHRHHDLDGLRRLLARLGRMARDRESPEEAAAHAEHACRTADGLRRRQDDTRARSSRRLTADDPRSPPTKGSQSVAGASSKMVDRFEAGEVSGRRNTAKPFRCVDRPKGEAGRGR